MLLSVMFQKTPFTVATIFIYGAVIFVLGFYYNANKYLFWASIISIMPWGALIYFQFLRRLYYLILHGGESSNGTGSPLLFLTGFLLELPFIIGISYICYNIYKDLENKRFNLIKE